MCRLFETGQGHFIKFMGSEEGLPKRTSSFPAFYGY